VLVPTIDLNADIGESYGAWRMGDDDAVLDVVTSANIACGYHAGDPVTMLATLRAAARREVRIGAHVSYPDLVGFGRRELNCAGEEIAADVLYQLGALQALARSVGTFVRYVKPHGALYNRACADPDIAVVIADALASVGRIPVLLLAGSPGVAAAEGNGRPVVTEAFADRAYTPDGALAPRRHPGAVISDEAAVVERCLRLATDGTVITTDGTAIRIGARSLCLHGDTPNAAALARKAREALQAAGIGIAAFA